ncbi:MAG: hypothetical protein MUE53_04405 [Chitinophagales bacterium]|jgi:hypothetical protein|nr:hypothetical protein [Chitinophagales bacterium]
MTFIALLLGLFSSLIAFVGVIPLLGWLNWLQLPFAGLGFILSLLVYNGQKDQASGLTKFALILNLCCLIFGGFRLMIGGGFL